MIDTHAHLTDSPYQGNIDTIVNEAKEAGLTGIVLASSNLEDSRAAIELTHLYPDFLFASVGIHPQQTDPGIDLSIIEQLHQLDRLILTNTTSCQKTKNNLPAGKAGKQKAIIVAIGECGLDYSPAPPGEKDRSPDDQETIFRGQINLSIKHDLPLIIHARQSSDEVIKILTEYPLSRGVFHCYSGGKKRITKILALPNRWHFGFDGNLTYEEGLSTVVKDIPADRIVIETDSPFLPPVPFRGQLNKPAYLPYIQKTINQIFHTDLTAQIANNSIALFSLPTF